MRNPIEILCKFISSRELGTFGMQMVSGDVKVICLYFLNYICFHMHECQDI